LNLYESGAKTLEAQIEHWTLVRKINVTYYYARKEQYTHLGLQPLPSLAVSEYKSKEAIQIVLLLRSLQSSPYASEEWSLSDTSAELIHSPPKNTLKKGAYRVDVWFDHDRNNSFPYTNYDFIYYQDYDEQWHKTAGLVDINGFYYEEPGGDRVYYFLFEADAARYGETGQWTVQFKNQTLSTSIPSSSRPQSTVSLQGSISSSSDSLYTPQRVNIRNTRSHESEEGNASSTTGTPPQTPVRPRRRRREGEPTSTTGESTRAKRRRRTGSVVGAAVSPGEVGSRHRSVPTSGLTRLARLEAEARDPLIVIFKGRSNQLKCWRYRIPKDLYTVATTVFRWAGDDDDENSLISHRMLVAFDSQLQRKHFLQRVSIPKGVLYAYGHLDSL
jgi:hypothetical protein